MALSLIDAHLHLQERVLAGDLPDVLRRAAEAGVRYMVCNGTSQADWPGVAELASANAGIIPCFGLHPWYVKQRSGNWLGDLEAFLTSTPSAIGEIGLDRWIQEPDEPAQEQVFVAQLDLARKLHRPVMIHCLRAWGWLMDVLAGQPPLPAGMLIHAYGGSVDLIKLLGERGAYFSFAGNVLEPRKTKARQSLKAVPLDRLLIESDSPALPPPAEFGPFTRPGPDGIPRNEPANLPDILRGIAQIRGEDQDTIAQATTANARRLLGEGIFR